MGSNQAEGMNVRVLFVISCVGSGIYDGLITRSEETYHVCVDVNVCDLETSKRGGLGSFWAASPQKETEDANIKRQLEAPKLHLVLQSRLLLKNV